MTVCRGVPTEYGYRLPVLRHARALPFLPRPARRVLDFGCGNGANTVLFAPDVEQMLGVDIEPAHVRVARDRARELGLGNVVYTLYDGDALPFRDRSFDAVVSFEVLEHTVDDRQALREIHRVLQPGGPLIMSVPNKWYLMETHGCHCRPTWVRWNRVPLLSWLPTPLHERVANARIYTRRRIVDLLTETGFTVAHHDYIQPPFDKVGHPRAKRVLQRVFHAIDSSPVRVVGVSHFLVAHARRL